jgi:hypothetical protein
MNDMLQDDLCRIRICPVKPNRDGSRASGIDKAVMYHLDMMLPQCHCVKLLKEVTIAGEVI